MRRKRSHLQVSTFPFLAVLLCAMGALILFLLVMDRRAKIVARNKAMKAVELAQEQEQQIEAELARRRKQQHDQLAGEQANLLAEQTQLQNAALSLQSKLQAGEQNIADLSQRLRAEIDAARKAEANVHDQRRLLVESKNQSGRTQARLLQLTAELEKLENNLKQMKAMNARPTEVVALAPYRGVHADQRRPIYVECRAEGFVVQPDRLVLPASATTPLDLRKAIESRLGQTDSAYVLFLVRPEGIPLYYQAQASLEGLRVDFGYEFVDSDWVLELSNGERTAVEMPPGPAAQPAPLTLGRVPLPQVREAPTTPGPRLANIGPGTSSARRSGFGATHRPEGRDATIASQERPRTVSTLPGVSLGQPTQTANMPATAPAPGLTRTTQKADPLPPPPTTLPPATPPPPPVGRLLGNRDLVFVLECSSDGVRLQQTNEMHALHQLKPGKTEHALVAEIRQFIARKQASVQPGESPFQPSIRFRISPDGLRAYYAVYPLLEPLRIPMARENVD